MIKEKGKRKIEKVIWFIFTFLLLTFNFALAQTKTHYDVDDFFKSGDTWIDSLNTIDSTSTNSFIRVISSKDSSADTIITRAIAIQGGGGDLYLNAGRDTIANANENWGTDTTQIWMGMYRGNGYPDAGGWEYHFLGYFDSDETLEFTLMDSTWNTKQPTDSVRFKILEQEAFEANYWWNLWFFKWKP